MFGFCHNGDQIAMVMLSKFDAVFCNVIAIAFIKTVFEAVFLQNRLHLVGILCQFISGIISSYFGGIEDQDF